MSNRIELTHKGWFGIAPVYYADTFSETPFITARHGIFEWALDFSHWLFDRIADMCEWMNPDYEFDGYPMTITGELKPGTFVEFDEE